MLFMHTASSRTSGHGCVIQNPESPFWRLHIIPVPDGVCGVSVPLVTSPRVDPLVPLFIFLVTEYCTPYFRRLSLRMWWYQQSWLNLVVSSPPALHKLLAVSIHLSHRRRRHRRHHISLATPHSLTPCVSNILSHVDQSRHVVLVFN